MADAIITDMAIYREKKLGKTLPHLTDEQVKTRYSLVKQIESGADFSDATASRLMKVVFPNGYDPNNHPEDNGNVLWAEGIRRGVFVP